MNTLASDQAFLEAARRFATTMVEPAHKLANRLGTEKLFRTMERLYDKQLEVVNHTSARLALCCTRRAGKTFLAPPWITHLGMTATDPETTMYFIAPTLDQAKSLLWRKFEILKNELSLDIKLRSDPWRVEFPTGAQLLFRGAQDEGDLAALRGGKVALCWVDETQDIKSNLLWKIETALGPALRDLNGRMIFSGTPGPIRAGRWFEISNGLTRNWVRMNWSLFDNPHLTPEAKDLKKIMEDEGFADENDPRFCREYRALWVEDIDTRVYKNSLSKNHTACYFQQVVNLMLEQQNRQLQWHYVIGVDFGFNDSSAVVVLAFSYEHDTVYVVDEWKKAKVTISDLMEQAVLPRIQKYAPLRIVGDSAAKQTIEEINQRWRVGMVPSDKTGPVHARKKAVTDLCNSDMQRGLIKIPPEMRLAHEMAELVWDPAQIDKGKWIEHAKRENHLCDAFLYGWRECKHWTEKSRPATSPWATDTEYQAHLLREAARGGSQQHARDWANDNDFQPTPDPLGLGQGKRGGLY